MLTKRLKTCENYMTHRRAIPPALMNADLKIQLKPPTIAHHAHILSLVKVEDSQAAFHPETHHLKPSSESMCRGSSWVLLQMRGSMPACICVCTHTHTHTYTQYIVVFIHSFKQYRLTTYLYARLCYRHQGYNIE